MYAAVDPESIKRLQEIAGESNVVTEHDKMIDYSHDEYSLEDIHEFPEVAVKPRSAEEVSEIVKLCNEKHMPLTPRGGGTGLCGGCVPVHRGVLLSFENMKQILEIDASNLTITAEAGVTLMDLYAALEEKGLFFPPHPGDESATLGGVIATNAGGARAVKYGVIRNFVKGIEAVLPDGSIEQFGGKFIKDSSGYSLMHLFIGSEGTLGCVTGATLNLMAPPQAVYTLVVPYASLADAIQTVPAILNNRILPMAVEFLTREPIALSEDYLQKKWPAPEGDAHLMIIIDAPSEDELMNLAEKIGEICLEQGAIDVFVAEDRSKQKTILDIRSQIYEAMKKYMIEILDICVPRGSIAEFVSEVTKIEEAHGMWLPTYGHAADGNIHTHIMRSQWRDGTWTEIEGWREKYEPVRDEVHEAGRKLNGSVSGEHGIGLIKKKYLSAFRGQNQLDMMKGIKQAFDPNNIMNPGKII